MYQTCSIISYTKTNFCVYCQNKNDHVLMESEYLYMVSRD